MKKVYCTLLIFLISFSSGYSQNNESSMNRALSSTFTPVIYIPGIMASPLYDDRNNNGMLETNERAWLGIQLAGMWLEPNGIDALGNFNITTAPLRNDTSNTLRDELNMTPMNLFKGFFDNLEKNVYVLDDYDDNHEEKENLFCFTYDWRKDNAASAKLLSQYIDSVKAWTGSAKVNLVGHSMGGIVAKSLINTFDKSRIDKMVFIGTPHLGAPEMLTVMLKGKLFEWINTFIADITVRSLSRNFPSCYQLIPSESYFNLEFNNNISSDVEIYSDHLQLPDGNYTNYSEMIEYLKKYKSSLGEDLNDFLIDGAEQFNESSNFIDFGDIKVFNIVGHNLPTIGKNKIYVAPPFDLITVEESRTLNGDYTVPLRSAEIINGKIFEHKYYIPDIKHSDLPGSKQTLEILLGILRDPPETDFPRYSKIPKSYAFPVTALDYRKENVYTFNLFQNYPNPFNPTTNFEFSIPDFSDGTTRQVSLKIYDVLGREAGTIFNEELAPGKYKLQWDATGLAAGIYFYTLQSGNSKLTKKLTLLK